MIRAVPERDLSEVDLLQELYSTGLLVGLLVDEELEKVGVPAPAVLVPRLGDATEPVTPEHARGRDRPPPTTIRDYVRRLVATRRRAQDAEPRGRRSYHLVLTAKGRRVAERGWPAVVAAFDRVDPHLERPAGEHLAAMRELREAVRLALAETEREAWAPGAAQTSRSTR